MTFGSPIQSQYGQPETVGNVLEALRSTPQVFDLLTLVVSGLRVSVKEAGQSGRAAGNPSQI